MKPHPRVKGEQLKCPYCGQGNIKRSENSSKFYNGKDYGPVYACTNFPECNTICVAYSKERRLYIGDKWTRDARTQTHKIFDRLWKEFGFKKRGAYSYLSQAMDKEIHETHIGMFNIKECREAYRIAARVIRKKLEDKNNI